MKKGGQKKKTAPEDLIIGRQPVLEALRYGRPLKVYLAQGQKGETIDSIVLLSRQKGISLAFVSRDELNELVREQGNHQGVAALSAPFRYLSLEQLISESKNSSPVPFLILLDHLQDPQNLGSIIRSADASGVCGIIIPEHRAAGITPTVRKVAAGGAERIRLARVKNLVQSMDTLKKSGFWLYGAEADGDLPYYSVDYKLPLALVLGSEDKGLSSLVRRHCDRVIHLPMAGPAGSLNVAVTAAVLMYAVRGQRLGWFA